VMQTRNPIAAFAMMAATAALVLAAGIRIAPAADPTPNALVAMEWSRAEQGDALSLTFAKSPAPWPVEDYDATGLTAKFVFPGSALKVAPAMRSLSTPAAAAGTIGQTLLRPLASGEGCEVVLSLLANADYDVKRDGNTVRVRLIGPAASKGDMAPAGDAADWSPNAQIWEELDGLVQVSGSSRRVIAQSDDAMMADDEMMSDGGMANGGDMGGEMGELEDLDSLNVDDLLGDGAVPLTDVHAFLPPVGNPEEKYQEIFQVSTTGIALDEAIARKRIENLRFRETPLQDALRLIASKADLNLLFNPEDKKIKRQITAELKNVALGDALEAILRVNGLAAVQEGDIIQIVDREQVVEDKIELDVRVRPLNWVRAENLEKTLKEFVSKANGAAVKADKESNVVIIKDTQKSIVKLLKLIDKLDIPEKQVMIEMRLVDYNLSLAREQGINWNLLRPDDHSLQQVGEAALGTSNGYGRDTQERLFGPALANALATQGTVGAVAAPAIGNLGGLVGGNGNPGTGLDVDGVGIRAPTNSGGAFNWDWGTDVTIFGNRFNLELAIQLLENRNIVSVLSNPRVITLNNIPARIEVIRREPFFESTESQAGNISRSTKFEDIGIRLNVTPNITNNDYVRMELAPEQFINRGVVFSNDQLASGIRVDRRQALTNVIVRDEDTIALGGLRSLDRTDNENGVPWLARVPVIGWLFKNSLRNADKTELMLFVRPKIVKDPTLKEQEQARYDEIDMSWVLPDYFFDDATVVPDDFFKQF
jgi:type IV pilus secretin PilQ/predicted competence protein